MKNRLAKVIAVLLTLAVIVGVLVTVASATETVENNLNVGDKYIGTTNPQVEENFVPDAMAQIIRPLGGAMFENKDGYYRFVANGGSITTLSSGSQYTDFIYNYNKQRQGD